MTPEIEFWSNEDILLEVRGSESSDRIIESLFINAVLTLNEGNLLN